jgi:hypothetical protein
MITALSEKKFLIFVIVSYFYGQGMQHAWEEWEKRTKFLSGNLKGKANLENLRVNGRIVLKYILKKYGVKLLAHMAQWQTVVNKVRKLRVGRLPAQAKMPCEGTWVNKHVRVKSGTDISFKLRVITSGTYWSRDWVRPSAVLIWAPAAGPLASHYALGIQPA